MRFEVVAIAAFAVGAYGAINGSAEGNGTVYETITTTALTTFCPASTTLTHGTNTYTVTAVSCSSANVFV